MKLNLVYFEIKKAFSHVYIIVLICVLLAANMVFCRVSLKENDWWYSEDYVDEVYSLYVNNPELYRLEYMRINAPTDFWDSEPSSDYSGGETADFSIFNRVDDFIRADELYHEKLDDLLDQSERIKKQMERNLQTSSDSYTKYNYRYQERIIKYYTELNNSVKLSGTVIYGWDSYFEYQAELIFTFAAVLLCSILISSNDYRSGFHTIEKSCVRGRESTALAKFAAATLMGIALTVIFYISSLIAAAITLDFSSALMPVQSVEIFKLCPYDISIAELLLISLPLKILASVLAAAIALAVTSASRRPIVGVVGGGLVLFFSYLISSSEIIMFGQARYINIWTIYNANDIMSRYRAINIFGVPVSLNIIIISTFAVLCGAALFVHLKGFVAVGGSHRLFVHRRRPEEKKTRKKAFKLPCVRSTSIFVFEQYKRAWLILLLAAAIIFKCYYSADYYNININTYARNYKYYMVEIEGEYSDDKLAYLQSEHQTYEQIIQQKEEMDKQYYDGSMPTEDYIKLASKASAAYARIEVLNDLLVQARYLQTLQRSGIAASFIDQRDYLHRLSYGTDWILAALIWSAGISAYITERRKTSSSSPPINLIQTMPHGRGRTFAVKYIISSAYALFAFVSFKIIDFVNYHTYLSAPPPDTLIISLPEYGFSSSTLTVRQHEWFSLIFSFIGAALILTVCFLISHVIKDGLASLIISLMIMFAPGLLEFSGVTLFRYFNINKLIDTEGLYRISSETAGGGIYVRFFAFFAVFALITGILAAISFSKIKRGEG